MKKFIFLIAGILLVGFTANATTNTTINYNRGYGNSFIFLENGIEFSVFPDGQFDFNISNHYGTNVSIGTPNVNFSFNSGYNYNPYLQYDEYGAIIQIEHTPIFYDFYGRIVQAGNININYNGFGHVSRVGGLYVHYNRFNRFSHCSGFINTYNRNYVFRPWHRYYRVPAVDYCVVYNRPYRRYYAPIRYSYTRPYYNNVRYRTSVASRRGHVINRSNRYTAINRGYRNGHKVNNYARNRKSYNQYRSSKKYENTRRNYKNYNRVATNNTPTRYNSNSNNAAKRKTTVTRRTVPNSNAQITRKKTTTVRQLPNNNKRVTTKVTRNRSAISKPRTTTSRSYNRTTTVKRSSGISQGRRSTSRSSNTIASRRR